MRGLHQRRRFAWRSIAIALILLSPTGCLTVASSVVGAGASAVDAYFDYKGAEKEEPVIVTPPIEAYSKELQDRRCRGNASDPRSMSTVHGERQRLLCTETPGHRLWRSAAADKSCT